MLNIRLRKRVAAPVNLREPYATPTDIQP
jgi:hypothetical protein